MSSEEFRNFLDQRGVPLRPFVERPLAADYLETLGIDHRFFLHMMLAWPQQRDGLELARRDFFAVDAGEVTENELRPLRILVVDDVEELRRGMCRILALDAHLPTGVGSPDEALQAVEKERFDLALVDMRLRDESGANLIRSLYQLNSDAIYVAMSGYSADRWFHDVLKAGACTFWLRSGEPDRVVREAWRLAPFVMPEVHRTVNAAADEEYYAEFDVLRGKLAAEVCKAEPSQLPLIARVYDWLRR